MVNEVDDEVIVETYPTGARFYARRGNAMEQPLIDEGAWEFRLQLKVLNRMGRYGTFVDCGANIGVHSCAVARSVGEGGRVIAIEPVPWLADRLALHRDLNALTNLQIVRQAVGSTREQRALFVAAPDAPDQVQGTFYGHQAELTQKIDVTVAPLDEILAKTTCEDIRVIKLDIEGAELEALRGARRTLKRWRPHLFFEYNEATWGEARASLADLQRLLVGEFHYGLTMLPDGNEKIYMMEAVPPKQKRIWLPWRH